MYRGKFDGLNACKPVVYIFTVSEFTKQMFSKFGKSMSLYGYTIIRFFTISRSYFGKKGKSFRGLAKTIF